jgi:uncharacterized phage protein (TIGR02220 family)
LELFKPIFQIKNNKKEKRMSKLLIMEKPLMILPKLAKEIGFNEALILQQMHYRLISSKHFIDGRKWIFNTYEEWLEQMPFWSLSTVRRTISSLEKKGLLISANYNQAKMDHTKWYSIDYVKLAELELDESFKMMDETPVQTEQKSIPERPAEHLNMDSAIPESTTEITTKKNKEDIPYAEIIHYLNEKTQSSYRVGTKKTKELIHARTLEGFTLLDFKRVIDLKTAEWIHDPYWSKFLRPEKLFGSKFESYLNQKSGNKLYRKEEFDLND